jgi:branched-chain amino acid transport system permease protein
MGLGLIAAAAVALFVAYFSTRLRDIYFAITTLIFSQIFYVIIFTWTEVTGGENGLIFSRSPLSIPFLLPVRFTGTTLHWFVLAVVTASYLILRRVTQSPFGMVLQSIRENEWRTRAIGYPVESYKIVAVTLSGLFAGLAGGLYAIQNQFAAPDFVYFLTSGDTVIFNVMSGIGTLVGPIMGAGTFQLLRELLSRLLGDQFPYLIPLGFVFPLIIIFLPQGLLGFARRWLNCSDAYSKIFPLPSYAMMQRAVLLKPALRRRVECLPATDRAARSRSGTYAPRLEPQ